MRRSAIGLDYFNPGMIEPERVPRDGYRPLEKPAGGGELPPVLQHGGEVVEVGSHGEMVRTHRRLVKV